MSEPEYDEETDSWAVRRLYRAGWSYRLIAQFCGMGSEEAREMLVAP